MKQNLLSSAEYQIYPGKAPAEFGHVGALNEAYRYWSGFWSKIYADAGTPESFNPDDFLRQDFVIVLKSQGEIAAMHLYSLFELSQLAAQEHHYFKFYPASFFEFMKTRNSGYVMSFEFLTVNPKFRKSQTGISLGEVLINCAHKFLPILRVDAGIAPARTDNKVNEMGYRVGWECFQSGIVKRTFSVDLVVGFTDKLKLHPDPELQEVVDSLWIQRKDFTGRTNLELSEKQAA